MVWVCPLCCANNSDSRSCAVCGAPRFYGPERDAFAPWEGHPVQLDRAALHRRGYGEIHRVFSAGRERYLLRDRGGRECILSLEQLLCMGILSRKEEEDGQTVGT